MYTIIDKRGTGKTSRLLLLAKDTGATIVCRNPAEMRTKAYAYGITGVGYISYDEYLHNMEDYNSVLIDNLDLCFPQIKGFSLTKED